MIIHRVRWMDELSFQCMLRERGHSAPVSPSRKTCAVIFIFGHTYTAQHYLSSNTLPVLTHPIDFVLSSHR